MFKYFLSTLFILFSILNSQAMVDDSDPSSEDPPTAGRTSSPTEKREEDPGEEIELVAKNPLKDLSFDTLTTALTNPEQSKAAAPMVALIHLSRFLRKNHDGTLWSNVNTEDKEEIYAQAQKNERVIFALAELFGLTPPSFDTGQIGALRWALSSTARHKYWGSEMQFHKNRYVLWTLFQNQYKAEDKNTYSSLMDFLTQTQNKWQAVKRWVLSQKLLNRQNNHGLFLEGIGALNADKLVEGSNLDEILVEARTRRQTYDRTPMKYAEAAALPDGKNSFKYFDLFGKMLRGYYLNGKSLAGTCLANAMLDGSEYWVEGAELTDAFAFKTLFASLSGKKRNYSNVSLARSYLWSVYLGEKRFFGANFSGAYLPTTTFSHSTNLIGCDESNALVTKKQAQFFAGRYAYYNSSPKYSENVKGLVRHDPVTLARHVPHLRPRDLGRLFTLYSFDVLRQVALQFDDLREVHGVFRKSGKLSSSLLGFYNFYQAFDRKYGKPIAWEGYSHEQREHIIDSATDILTFCGGFPEFFGMGTHGEKDGRDARYLKYQLSRHFLTAEDALSTGQGFVAGHLKLIEHYQTAQKWIQSRKDAHTLDRMAWKKLILQAYKNDEQAHVDAMKFRARRYKAKALDDPRTLQQEKEWFLDNRIHMAGIVAVYADELAKTEAEAFAIFDALLDDAVTRRYYFDNKTAYGGSYFNDSRYYLSPEDKCMALGCCVTKNHDDHYCRADMVTYTYRGGSKRTMSRRHNKLDRSKWDSTIVIGPDHKNRTLKIKYELSEQSKKIATKKPHLKTRHQATMDFFRFRGIDNEWTGKRGDTRLQNLLAGQLVGADFDSCKLGGAKTLYYKDGVKSRQYAYLNLSRSNFSGTKIVIMGAHSSLQYCDLSGAFMEGTAVDKPKSGTLIMTDAYLKGSEWRNFKVSQNVKVSTHTGDASGTWSRKSVKFKWFYRPSGYLKFTQDRIDGAVLDPLSETEQASVIQEIKDATPKTLKRKPKGMAESTMSMTFPSPEGSS